MHFRAKILLPALISGAMILSACSASNASGIQNDGQYGENIAVDLDTHAAELIGEDGDTSTGDSDFDPTPLCLEVIGQRFGIDTNVIVNSMFAGGDDAQTFSGDVTVDLRGPPARRFVCALTRGAVMSVVEVDSSGPVQSGID